MTVAVRGGTPPASNVDEALRDHIRRTGTVPEVMLRELVSRIVEEVAPEKIILFGSAARGQMTVDSDLDLLVVKSGTDRRDTARRIYRALRGLGVAKDIIVTTPELVEQYKDVPGYIYRPALREGRVIYAQ